MSTRSNIRIYREDGTRTGIYCHSDGYEAYNGVILQAFYNTPEKVEALLALGDMKFIGPKIPKSPDDFMKYEEWAQMKVPDSDTGFCAPFTMWRGETFSQSLQDEEFVYIYDERERYWIVQSEQKIHSDILDENWFGGMRSRFLIDALADEKTVTPNNWKDWESDGVTLESCKKSAMDARADMLAERAREYDAYYRAYCD